MAFRRSNSLCRIPISLLLILGLGVMKPPYSTIQAWNADQSRMILYGTEGGNSGHYLYDGQTYALIGEMPDNFAPHDLEQFAWSTTDPCIVYFPYSWEMSGQHHRELKALKVCSGQDSVVADFNSANVNVGDLSWGNDPMYPSWDNDAFGFVLSSSNAFVYRLSGGHRCNVQSSGYMAP